MTLPDILLSETGALMGLAEDETQALLDAGVVYICPEGVPGGPCGFEHSGGAFLHYCAGKDHDDYHDVIYGEVAER